jgi:hypothetical protein
VPRFPLLLVVGLAILWRSWKDRQQLSLELRELTRTRQQLQVTQ